MELKSLLDWMPPRQFYESLPIGYRRLALTDADKQRLLERLEQLTFGTHNGEGYYLAQLIMIGAEVLEARKYSDGTEIVRYQVEKRHLLVVQYDSEGKILRFTPDPNERKPMEFEVARMPYEPEILHWEDALDNAWNLTEGDWFCVNEEDGDSSSVSVTYMAAGEEFDDDLFRVEFNPWGFDSWAKYSPVITRREMAECVRRYLRAGFAEAASGFELEVDLDLVLCYRDWKHDEYREMQGDCLMGRRLHDPNIRATYREFEYYPGEWCDCPLIYDRRLIHRALYGDVRACRSLARCLHRRKKWALSDYWCARAGITPYRFRKRKKPHRELPPPPPPVPDNQLYFDFS